MPTPQQGKQWTTERAVLFVHGVGNAAPGHYDDLAATLGSAIGDPNVQSFTPYVLYYDELNEWFERKTRFGNILAALELAIRNRFAAETEGSGGLAEVAANFAGDVLYPVLIQDAREAVLRFFINQIHHMRLDGKLSGFDFYEQKISIVAHSLGCFHTFEALHRMAADPRQRLLPVTDLMTFENVIFMASPVQLIRTVASAIQGIVPGRLATTALPKLTFPFERTLTGDVQPSSHRWISITGDLDPVGGHLFRKLLKWAYADISEQASLVDAQTLANGASKDELKASLREALSTSTGATGMDVSLNNPHSWTGYIERNAGGLAQWFA